MTSRFLSSDGPSVGCAPTVAKASCTCGEAPIGSGLLCQSPKSPPGPWLNCAIFVGPSIEKNDVLPSPVAKILVPLVLYRYRSVGKIVLNGGVGSADPSPSTSSISCSITASRSNWPLVPELPGVVSDVFTLTVPSTVVLQPVIPTALRFAVLTLMLELPFTGLFALEGSCDIAVVSSPLFASASSAARNVAYETLQKNVELCPRPVPIFANVMLTVMGSLNID